jgi:membrane protein implicated in regulation of membrane protease activity
MDFQASTLWWVAAGVLVAVELGTGTFYLLMLALGAACGAIAAHLGFASTAQIAIAALVGGGATALWHWKRQQSPAGAPPEANRDVQIDIGHQVQVDAWQPGGLARVSYRGASWQVRFAGTGTPAPGAHVIVAVDGNQLQVAPAAAT